MTSCHQESWLAGGSKVNAVSLRLSAYHSLNSARCTHVSMEAIQRIRNYPYTDITDKIEHPSTFIERS